MAPEEFVTAREDLKTIPVMDLLGKQAIALRAMVDKLEGVASEIFGPYPAAQQAIKPEGSRDVNSKLHILADFLHETEIRMRNAIDQISEVFPPSN